MLTKRGLSGDGAGLMHVLGNTQASLLLRSVIYFVDASVLEVAAGRFPGLKGSRPCCLWQENRVGRERQPAIVWNQGHGRG
jgi:hypothetical protein